MESMKVSIIMAAYNAEKYIHEAVQSILNQTYSDFEFLIVNDGSNDDTSKILSQYHDRRIKVFYQPNQGCIYARESAIERAKGEYIAIMDADDIALPERLEKTVEFLDANPEVVLVGTGFIIKNEESGEQEIKIPPSSDEKLRKILLRYDPFKDPSLLIRKSAFKTAGGYKVDHGFDYELYSRLAKIGKLANIEDILLIIRQHNRQFFRMGHSPEEHRKRRLKIRWLTLWRLNPPFFLFFQTLIWLCFEYITHLFPEELRYKLPENFRSLFKTHLPPKV